MKLLLSFALLLVFVSIITTNIYILGVAEFIAIPTIILLFIKQQKNGESTL
jgi:hypothetical protein